MDEQLIIGIEISLDNVDLLLQLLGDLDNLVFRRPARDRVFMYAVDAGCRLDAETFRLSIFTWRRVNTAVT